MQYLIFLFQLFEIIYSVRERVIRCHSPESVLIGKICWSSAVMFVLPLCFRYIFRTFWVYITEHNLRMELQLFLLIHEQKVSTFKGYLRYKTIFCHKVAIDVQLMIFFIWSKNNAPFPRYLDFCTLVKSTDFEICDVIAT